MTDYPKYLYAWNVTLGWPELTDPFGMTLCVLATTAQDAIRLALEWQDIVKEDDEENDVITKLEFLNTVVISDDPATFRWKHRCLAVKSEET